MNYDRQAVDSYPLSPMQLGMLYHWLRDPDAGVDIEQICCTVRAVEIAGFIRAWETVTQRHAALRTVFRWRGVDVPLQDVLAGVPLDIREEDWRTRSEEARRVALAEFLDADRRRGLDFATPPLFRLTFFRTAEDEYEFVWTFPHILLDGRSFVLLLREVIEVSRDQEAGRAPALPTPRPYRDYIDWLGGLDPEPATAFWQRALKGFTDPVFPELGSPEAAGSAPEYAGREIRMSRAETGALREFVQRHGLTVNTMVQGAWALLLGRYAGTDDIVFGATRACRRTPLDGDSAVDRMVGLFINTLPVRVRMPPDQPVVAWLKQIREDQVAVRAVEHTPLTQVQAASEIPPGTALFDTLLVYENERQSLTMDALDQRFTGFRLLEKTNVPLTLHGYGEGELLLRIEYYRSRLEDKAVTAMLGHLVTLLREMVEHGDRPIGALELLTPGERRRLLEEWNQGEAAGVDPASYPRNALVHQLFAEQVRRTPDAVAVVYQGDSFSYAELDRRASLLARRLGTLGVGAGTLVGLCTERSFDMVVGTLAILKAGGAYVPLDPAYPVERLAFMLTDAPGPVILVQQHLEQRLRAALSVSGVDSPTRRLLVLEAAASSDPHEPPALAEPELTSESPAYVIYTSGSTGRPKGVVVPHRAVVRLVRDTNYVQLGPQETILGFAPISFDAATFEIWGALLNGGRLVLAPSGLELTELGAMIAEHGVTTAWLTAALFQQVVETDLQRLRGVKQLLAGGDVLSVPHVRKALAELPGCRLINGYGPTENTTFTCCYTIPADWPDGRPIPIGRPVAHTRVYVLDPRMRPVPVGVPGELYAGGLGVALGYLNRPELTAERFVADPFSPGSEAPLYKTGDRVRWRAGGAIDFLGRFDDQVKIRGFRVEPGEIEARLLAHPEVSAAAVVVSDDTGERRLVAYLVARSGTPVPTAALRDHLVAELPHYMVPAAFVWLAELPLSSNGKVNRRALPAPQRDISQDKAVPPRDETESRLLQIWEQVLGVKNIGVTDRFNEVGGNSLAAVRVFMRVSKEFGQELQLVTMLRHDTVERLAQLLGDPSRRETWQCIVPLTTRASGIPIFCPHAQTGNVLIYQHFAKEVAEHHPVYGIQAFGNWGTQEPHESVGEMVKFYVDEILKIRPQGPYIFLGGSLGGLIALELAHAMRERGHEVRMLAMYDTAGPGYPRYKPYGRLVKFILRHGGIPLWRLRRVVTAGPGNERSARKILWRVKELASWWLENTRRDFLYWKFEHRNPPADYALPANLTRVRLASRRVWRGYQPRFYPGKITYFRASIQPAGIISDPTNGWEGMAEELEIHSLPGGHTGGMSYPVVVDVARIFLKSLENSKPRV